MSSQKEMVQMTRRDATHASPISLRDLPSVRSCLILSSIAVKEIELPLHHCKNGGITPVVEDGADGGGEWYNV
jgi:hypothetical protein